eukprot:SAG31_NODE_8047_length_1534_cov_0.907317_2_plen_90_part_01
MQTLDNINTYTWAFFQLLILAHLCISFIFIFLQILCRKSKRPACPLNIGSSASGPGGGGSTLSNSLALSFHSYGWEEGGGGVWVGEVVLN